MSAIEPVPDDTVKPKVAVTPLFIEKVKKPYVLYIHTTVPDSDNVLQTAKAHGATIVDKMEEANYVLLDPDNAGSTEITKQLQPHQIGLDYHWVTESVTAGTKRPHRSYVMGDGSKGAGQQRKKRSLFTDVDDDLLIDYHARKPAGFPRKQIEEELARDHPRHSYHSWQERYKRSKGGAKYWEPLIIARRRLYDAERLRSIRNARIAAGQEPDSDEEYKILESQNSEFRNANNKRRRIVRNTSGTGQGSDGATTNDIETNMFLTGDDDPNAIVPHSQLFIQLATAGPAESELDIKDRIRNAIEFTNGIDHQLSCAPQIRMENPSAMANICISGEPPAEPVTVPVSTSAPEFTFEAFHAFPTASS